VRRLRRVKNAGRCRLRHHASALLVACPPGVHRTREGQDRADRHRTPQRIAALYAIEAELRGKPPDLRRTGRQATPTPSSMATACDPDRSQIAELEYDVSLEAWANVVRAQCLAARR